MKPSARNERNAQARLAKQGAKPQKSSYALKLEAERKRLREQGA